MTASFFESLAGGLAQPRAADFLERRRVDVEFLMGSCLEGRLQSAFAGHDDGRSIEAKIRVGSLGVVSSELRKFL